MWRGKGGLAIAPQGNGTPLAAKAVPDRRTEARPIHAHTFCRPAVGEQKINNGDIGRCSRSTDAEEGRISLCCSLGPRFVQPLCGLDHADSDLQALVDREVVVDT